MNVKIGRADDGGNVIRQIFPFGRRQSRDRLQFEKVDLYGDVDVQNEWVSHRSSDAQTDTKVRPECTHELVVVTIIFLRHTDGLVDASASSGRVRIEVHFPKPIRSRLLNAATLWTIIPASCLCGVTYS